jgi:hypothetical protein
MAQEALTLDGLGLLGLVNVTPTQAGVITAKVQGPSGVETMYVLTLSTSTGCHVTYWTRDRLVALTDSLIKATTGIEVGHTVADIARGNGNAH